MHTRTETVTPERAKLYLSRNTTNRPLSESRVDQYAREITLGKWLHTHQGLAFDEDGNLVDGQHRLAAIVRANVAAVMQIAEGVERKTALVVDQQKTRTLTDQVKIEGMEVPPKWEGVVRGMFFADGKLTPSEIRELAHQHDDAIRFAIRAFAKTGYPGGVKTGVVMGVVARAVYCEKEERLLDFSDVLRSGMMQDPGDGAAIKLRNYLISDRKGSRNEVYWKTERALFAFCSRESLTNLYEAATEIYPLQGLGDGIARAVPGRKTTPKPKVAK